MIEFHPCPSCGAEKIRTTVHVCSSCEISERYEKQIDELKAKCERLEKKVDLACRGREEAKLQRDNLRIRLEEITASYGHREDEYYRQTIERRIEVLLRRR